MRGRLERIEAETGITLGEDLLLDDLDAAKAHADLVQLAVNEHRASLGLGPRELSHQARKVVMLEYAVDRRQRRLAYDQYVADVILPASRLAVRVST